jgi:hypothetical protein
MDDSDTREVSSANVVSGRSYVMFYKRRDLAVDAKATVASVMAGPVAAATVAAAADVDVSMSTSSGAASVQGDVKGAGGRKTADYSQSSEAPTASTKSKSCL